MTIWSPKLRSSIIKPSHPQQILRLHRNSNAARWVPKSDRAIGRPADFRIVDRFQAIDTLLSTPYGIDQVTAYAYYRHASNPSPTRRGYMKSLLLQELPHLEAPGQSGLAASRSGEQIFRLLHELIIRRAALLLNVKMLTSFCLHLSFVLPGLPSYDHKYGHCPRIHEIRTEQQLCRSKCRPGHSLPNSTRFIEKCSIQGESSRSSCTLYCVP